MARDAQIRVLLRDTQTGVYFQGAGRWTADRLSAHDFGTGGRAVLFALDVRLPSVEVVLAFEDPRYDLTMPLTEGLGQGYGGSASRPGP